MFIAKLIPPRVFSLQARRPSGTIGRYLMTKIFNSSNADLNSYVKEMLDLKRSDKVLEIGFGPGKLINQMAEITTDGVVEGIDFSQAMLKQAGKVNKQYISIGRVILHAGECGSLPFENESFDKVCSINTIYFWDVPVKYFSEIYRVAKAGGKVVIGFRDDKQMGNLNLSEDVFSSYSHNDVVKLLSDAGFSDVRIKEKDGVPFVSYCAVASKA